MVCKKCGAQNEDDVKVCASCGEELEAEETLEATETIEVEDALEVPEEETEENSIEEVSEALDDAEEADGSTEANTEETEDGETEVFEEPKKKSPLGKIIAIAVIIVAVLLGIKFIPGFFKEEKVDFAKLPVAYMKDGNTLMIKAAGKTETIKVAENYSGEGVKTTVDGKKVFYTKLDEKSGKSVLYCLNTDKKDSKGTKITTEADDFSIASDGSFVVYLKENKLYMNNLKKETKIADKADGYIISADDKNIIYYVQKTEEKDGKELVKNDYYSYSKGKSAKIASDVESAIFLKNEDSGKEQYNGEFYYLNDGTLYFKKGNKKAVKILDKVSSAEYLDGKLYAVKTESKEVKYEDLVIDDCKEEDEKVVPPVEADFQKDGSDGNKVLDEEKYNEAYEAYVSQMEKIQYRMYIRQYLENRPIEKQNSVLYLVEGTKAKAIEKDFLLVSIPNRLGYKESGKKGEKIKLSTIKSEEDYSSIINKVAGGVTGDILFYAIKPDGKTVALKNLPEEATSLYADDEGNNLLCLENVVHDKETYMSTGTLVKYKITSKGVSGRKEIAKNVSGYYMTENGEVIILSKDGEKEILGVYADKYEKLAENAALSSAFESTIYYFVNQNDEENSADLMKCEIGKKPVKVDSRVYTAGVDARSEGLCYYIKNYDAKNGAGELYVYDTKAKLVDKKVSGFVNIQ